MSYKGRARAALLSKKRKTQTVIVDVDEEFQEDFGMTEIIVVLQAPKETKALEIYEIFKENENAGPEVAAKMLVEMAYSPVCDEDGEPINYGVSDEIEDFECKPDEPMFEDTPADLGLIADLAMGHPFFALREYASVWARELGEAVGKRRKKTPESGGITVLPNSSEEGSPSETLPDGTLSESASG